MKESKADLRKRIVELEAELGHYMDIAAHYRACLGDVKANQILSPFFNSRRDRLRATKTDWQEAIKRMKGEIK